MSNRLRALIPAVHLRLPQQHNCINVLNVLQMLGLSVVEEAQ